MSPINNFSEDIVTILPFQEKDPMSTLPQEMFGKIFSDLGVQDQIHSAFVCKAWHQRTVVVANLKKLEKDTDKLMLDFELSVSNLMARYKVTV